MSQFENSEIMMEYAKIMGIPTSNKTGYFTPNEMEIMKTSGVIDLATDLGIAYLFTEASVKILLANDSRNIAAGIYKQADWFDSSNPVVPMAGQLAGGAAGQAGMAAIKNLAPKAKGLGGAAVGLAGSGLGWLGSFLGLTGGAAVAAGAGIVAGVAGAGYLIWKAVHLSDKEVSDLVERLQALDYEGTSAEGAITKWIGELSNINLSVIPFDQNNPGQMVNAAQTQLAALKQAEAVITNIESNFPSVKKYLKDWDVASIGDISNFERAVKTFKANNSQRLAEIQAKAKESANQLLSQKSETSKVNYTQLAENIKNIDSQIVSLYNNKPIRYSPQETMARNLATNILEGSATEEEFNQSGTAMVVLHDTLVSALEAAKQQIASRESKQKSRVSSTKPPISKRALKLPDGTPVGPQAGGRSGAGGAGEGRYVKNPQVKSLQILINRLNIALRTGIDRIDEDGAYGVNTAAAFTGLVSKKPDLDEYLRKYVGLDEKSIVDFKIMSDPTYLNGAVKILSAYLQKVAGGTEAGGADGNRTQQDPTQGVMCNPNKANPSPEEVSACLRSIIMDDPKSGREVSLYMFLQDKGMSEQAMREYIYRKYRARAPRDWSWSEISDDFKEGRYSF